MDKLMSIVETIKGLLGNIPFDQIISAIKGFLPF